MKRIIRRVARDRRGARARAPDHRERGGERRHRAQSLEGEQIEVAAVWTGAEQKNFKRVLDAFTKQTGVDVTFTSTGDDISSVLEPRIAGGDAPDVAILPQPGLLKDFASRGALKSVEDAAGSAGRPALLADLAHARHRRQHALRRVGEGRQQVVGLVQRERLRRRGREAGEELRRPAVVDADDLRLRRAAAVDRCRQRVDAHRHLREHLPGAGRRRQVRPADVARDPVDRPVGQGRARRPWRRW